MDSRFLWAIVSMLAYLLLASRPACAQGTVEIIQSSTSAASGLVIGDVLEQDIRVKASSGFRLDTALLPEAGSAHNDYLEIHGATWSESSGFATTSYDIHLSYQVFKGVRSVERLKVGALALRFSREDEVVNVEVPEWSFTLNPIITPDLADEDVKLADELPVGMPQLRDSMPVLSGLIVVGFGMSLYGAWRLQLPPFQHRRRPFAQTRKGLRKLRRLCPAAERERRALRMMHRAFDQTAGRTLFAGELDPFFAERPLYTPLRDQIESFFALSRLYFFAADSEGAAANKPLANLSLSLGGEGHGTVLQWLDGLCLQLDRLDIDAA